MVLTLKKDTDKKQLDTLTAWLNSQNIKVHISKGESVTIVGLVGDTSRLDTDLIQGLSMVENVTRITEPYKNANRKFHPADTVVDIGGVKIGFDESTVVSWIIFSLSQVRARLSQKSRYAPLPRM